MELDNYLTVLYQISNLDLHEMNQQKRPLRLLQIIFIRLLKIIIYSLLLCVYIYLSLLIRSDHIMVLLTACFIHFCQIEISLVDIMRSTQTAFFLSHGVPQGSLLGPLLLLIFINDFVKTSAYRIFIVLAYDNIPYASGNDIIKLTSNTNREQTSITKWIFFQTDAEC